MAIRPIIPLNLPLKKGDLKAAVDRSGQIMIRKLMQYNDKPGEGVQP